ncbi:hypothetical protein Pcinc_019619 [Petrolisthes cinctipes]|uniref:Myb-like domain-containing protein n=1 Tax=Petrolisthes cinctipes TaxID=88211 RepID=A0AAE1FKY8_PETCI|nr:hypothetical protein Pcinc_019619 [Petrolisthes cinctipes]
MVHAAMSKKDIKKISVGRPSAAAAAAAGESDSKVHWGHENVLNLVAKVKDHWDDFSLGVRKKKFIWTDIAYELSREGFHVTGIDCDRKWRNLKIRYLAVLEKHETGEKSGHRIDYFDSIHSFLKDDEDTIAYLLRRKQQPFPKQEKSSAYEDEEFSETSAEGGMEWTEKSVQLLLDLLLEFRDAFTNKEGGHADDTVWEAISEQMKLEGHKPGPEQCRRKWSYLVSNFHQQKAEAEAKGSVPLWPYYTRVRNLITQIGIPEPITDVDTYTPIKRRSRGTRVSPRKRMKFIKQEIQDPEYVLPTQEEDEEEDIFLASTSNEPTFKSPRTKVKASSYLLPSEIQEVCDRLDRVEENMAVCRRLEHLEARLDDVSQQQQAQSETNLLLTQVLSELSRLSHAITNRYNTQTSTDPTDLSTGITIVVPHSQQLP